LKRKEKFKRKRIKKWFGLILNIEKEKEILSISNSRQKKKILI